MSLDWSAKNIKNYMDVIWLDIKNPEDPEKQEVLESNVQNGRGRYLRADPDDESSPYVKYFNPVTDTLIWGTLDTQIGTITKDNYREVWMRLAMCDAIYGEGRLSEYDKAKNKLVRRSLTLGEVYAHIGLATNVSPKKTPTQWYKNMLNRVPTLKEEK